MRKAPAIVATLSLTVLGLCTTGMTAHAAGGATPRHRQQIVVPAYFKDSPSWNAVDSGVPADAMAIANVANGPGDAVDPAWQPLIGTAHRSGVRVLGYVDTGYFGTLGALTRGGEGSVSAWLAQAKADIGEWFALYGSGIGGIYFDEALRTCGTNNEYVRLYAHLSDYVKAIDPGAVTVLSPGGDVPRCYLRAADTIVRFEGTYASYQGFVPGSWESAYAPDKFMEIVHDTPSASLSSALGESRDHQTGYVYVTDQAYSSLPSYWGAEVFKIRHHGAV